MSDVKPGHFVLSDTHLGHDKILSICRPWFKDIKEHDEYIINQINKTCGPNDYLWLLGDVAFTRDGLMLLKDVKCHLGLVGGNHDNFSADAYLRVFNKIRGVAQANVGPHRVLLTHIPMHPDQTRWSHNVHGHLHTYHVDDDRYINVSCEPMDFTPRQLEDLIKSREKEEQYETQAF